jgi:hypothetical protein
MDWGAAFVAIFVALIAASFGFVGGYYGARWQAQSNLEQWQRDELLKVCTDFIAVSGEIVEVGREIQDFKNPLFPTDVVGRFMQAYAGICLLSNRLAASAHGLVIAAMGILTEGPVVSSYLPEGSPALARTAAARGLFLRAAHNILLDQPRPVTTPRRMWRRLPTGVRDPLTRAAIFIGLIPQPLAPAPPAATAAAPPPD